jgi:hypothetical protein
MRSGITIELLVPAITCGAIALLIFRRFLSWTTAFATTAIKVGIPLLYFAYFYDGTWQMIDDILYHDFAVRLLGAGYGPVTIFTNDVARASLFDASSGWVLGYWWWNVFAEWVFGLHYFSAVFMNIIAAAGTGFYVHRLAIVSGFGPRYARAVAVFAVLHWDLLLWSGFLNSKDAFVLLFTAAALLYLMELTRAGPLHRTAAFLKLMIVLALLFSVRFYSGALLLIGYGIWLLLRRQNPSTFIFLGSAAAAMMWFLRVYSKTMSWFDFSVFHFVFGIVHFVLTPQPWSTESNYSFIVPAAFLHWIFFLPALIGLVVLWRSMPDFRLVLIYLILVIAFYALVPELQGPRQRLTVSFIWAWMEFHFFYLILTPVKSRERPASVALASAPAS